MPKRSILMIFIDGVGIGLRDANRNPFFQKRFRFLEDIFKETPSLEQPALQANGFYLFPADARLGVEGFPQSGTGQASIFGGFNAPERMGTHFGPYPHHSLVPELREKNIFEEMKRRNKKSVFANAYPKQFFEYLASGKTRTSVTTLSCRLAGIPLKHATDLRRGKAVAAEITNERWISQLKYTLPKIQPKTAARRLLRLVSDHHFTLYEYFLTDFIGHLRITSEKEHLLSVLDEFLFTIMTEFDTRKTTLLICSDHGNMEDLSTKTHTLNPALTITGGFHAREVSESIKDLTHIKQALLSVFE